MEIAAMPLKELVIDLSHWNDVTDPSEVVASGIVGVIYKCSEGTTYVDDSYERAKQACNDLGLLFGAYHFLRPGKMHDQAEWFVENAGKIDLYAADHEDDGVSLEDLKEFLQRVYDLTGKRPIIYSGHVLKNQMPGNVRDGFMALHRLWLAQYTTGTPSWPTATWPKWWLWQHTDEGSVPGIDGDVDMNYYDGSEDQLVEEWTGQEQEESDEIVVKIIVPQGVKVIVEEE
jgi:lysozyme